MYKRKLYSGCFVPEENYFYNCQEEFLLQLKMVRDETPVHQERTSVVCQINA